MRSAGTLIVLLGLLAASAGVALWAWREIGEVEISGHGLIALGLGVVVTFLVGAGLMALLLFSARRGYDERAHETQKRFEDPAQGPRDEP